MRVPELRMPDFHQRQLRRLMSMWERLEYTSSEFGAIIGCEVVEVIIACDDLAPNIVDLQRCE